MVTTPEGMRNAAGQPGRDVDAAASSARGGWARWAWRRLTSMRTALLLLMLLAVAAVPGSVFPQRRIDPTAVAAYLDDHPASGPWLDRLGAFDVYASPWFSAVYLLLFVSLVGCVVPRSRLHWRAVRARPPATPRRLDRMPAYAQRHGRRRAGGGPGGRPHDAGPPPLPARGRRGQRRRRARARRGDRQPACSTSRSRRCSSAIAAGSFLGYSGQALVVEGETWANTLPRYDSFTPGRAVDGDDLPPFSLTLDHLAVEFEDEVGGNQFGAAAAVRGGPDGPARRRRARRSSRIMRVNKPLDVGGTRMFLVGNGYAPVVTVRDGEGNVVPGRPGAVPAAGREVHLERRRQAAGRAAARSSASGRSCCRRSSRPRQGPLSVFPDATRPRLVLTAWTGDLGMDDGAPQSVYVLDTSRMEPLRAGRRGRSPRASRRGQTVTLPGRRRHRDVRRGSTGTRPSTSGTTRRRSGCSASPSLSLAGLTASLFVRRRRVWVRATLVPDDADGVRTLVEVAGLSRSEDARLGDEVRSLLDAVPGAGPAAAAEKG